MVAITLHLRCTAHVAVFISGSESGTATGTGIVTGVVRGIAGTETGQDEATGKGATGIEGIGIGTGIHQGGMATGNPFLLSASGPHNVEVC